MKIRLLVLLGMIAFFSSNVAAQVNRDIGRSYSQPKPKKDNTDYLELSVVKLAEELKLDNFQQAVIKDLLKKNQEDQAKIIAEDIPSESKTEKLLALRNEVQGKIKEVLTPEQAVAFEALANKKKKKK